jgi:cytochrome c oxidase subunit 2
MSKFLPPAAAAHASDIDAIMGHVHLTMAVLFTGWLIYFLYVLFRYRADRNPVANPAGTRGRVAMFIFAGVMIAEATLLVGFALPMWFVRTGPPPASDSPLIIRVVAQQFAWNVHYAGPDGRFGETSMKLISDTNPVGVDRNSQYGKDDLITIGDLHLPVNRPVVIELSSLDVIHSFGITAMRVKQDVNPGLASTVWFTPTEIGEFEVACSQLCGAGHYRMRAVVTVESEAAFRTFLATK